MTHASQATDDAALRGEVAEHARARLLASREELAELWLRLSALDPGAYERSAGERVAHLLQTMDATLRAVVNFTLALMGQCDEATALVGATAYPGGPIARWSGLSDVCFMAASEISLKRQELKELTPELTRRRTMSTCGGALRRARRALVSVDTQLAEFLGLAPMVDTTASLQEALELRRQYSVLRRTAEGDGPPAGPALAMRLRSVDLRISLLAEKETYSKLRVDDRIELELLQRRLRSWLEGEKNETAGTRLWQDVLGFMQLLCQVNLRSDLRAHDAALVRTLRDQLEQNRRDVLEEALCESMRPLIGLHDRLDDLLRLRERSRELYDPVVRELAERLLPSAVASGHADSHHPWTLDEPTSTWTRLS
jgi:hypothetical protein